MPIKPSGTIGMNDVTNEFSSTPPDDQFNEYYRDGVLVTDNNTNIPNSGNPLSLEHFYSAELIYSRIITANADNIVLSSYFTPDEWNSSAPKQVIINSGVNIGSYDAGIPAARTGILAGSSALGGTLTLIVNGNIYGAGGAGGVNIYGGTGGAALNAEIPLIVINNSRIYGGGGGGGSGGDAGDCYYYPYGIAYQYSKILYGSMTNGWSYRLSSGGVLYLAWNLDSPTLSILYRVPNPDLITTFVSGSFTYERGVYKAVSNDTYSYSVRRKYTQVFYGTNGTDGGHGIGAHDAQTNSSYPTTSGFSLVGGKGGNGGGWGANGGNGAGGEIADNYYKFAITASQSGFSRGLGGYYIIGNANVTWSVQGLRLGRVG